MSKSTDVATTTPAGLPALPAQPLNLDAGDVSLPRLKVGQPGSPAVVSDLVPKGGLFSTTGQDDEYPEELYKFGEDKGLLVHVLDVWKNKSITTGDDELVTFAFDDPEAPADAKVAYNYVLCLPEHDTEVPYKFLMKSTATSTAKQINTVLKRNEARGPSYATAFRITTKKREAEKNGQKFVWYVPVVRVEDATQAGIDASSKLAGMIAGSSIERTAPAGDDGPAI